MTPEPPRGRPAEVRACLVAAFGPSGISESVLQRRQYERLCLHLPAGERLGDAIRAAKAEGSRATPQVRPVVAGFNLLGDPNLAMPLTPATPAEAARLARR